MLSERIFNPKGKTLILHSKKFKGKELRNLLLKNFPQIESENILQYDNYPNNATKNAIQDFLKQTEINIGIFHERFGTGIESSSVIYSYDAVDIDSNVRCTMTRAVSHLCIILRFENEPPTTFESVTVNNKFIKCIGTTQLKGNYFECRSCKVKPICVPCLFVCHKNDDSKIYNRKLHD